MLISFGLTPRRHTLARRGSGLRTAIKIVKAIDRASKQAAREAQRRENARQRAAAQAQRDYQRTLRENERALRESQRELKLLERQQNTAAKQAFKDALANANEEYQERCEERSALRKQFIQEVLR